MNPTEPALLLEFDPQSDAIYVRLKPEYEHGRTHVRGTRLDERRYVLYDDTDTPVGVELFAVSQGIDLDGLPQAAAIEAALRAFPRLAA